ncbi:hypothetical protein M7I_6099 [Glarea lozoyensis 74030]|uniref:Large ribosomal subunit protein mL67 n=1 Tax=Glarea lozoyensis (strain ATCC 74030 / MF5533) TaxID=1104152 RepID=H0ETN2_GLAL7|nr:hypothetical protein M7I_6099 [Glarea lozoyensis 74030]
MNIQSSSRIARRAILCIRGARHNATATTPPAANLTDVATTASPSEIPITSSELQPTPEAPAASKPVPEPTGERGQTIYVFRQVQWNQVVYSLQKSMKNNHALKQLPYNGKKTVPAALRKDLWTPLAAISFPTALHGRSAYQKLREYAKRHALEWEPHSLNVTSAGIPVPKQKRGRLLNDQKANSIADLAPAIGNRLGLYDESQGAVVGVRWADIADANFAKSWSSNVVHNTLTSLYKNPFVGALWGSLKTPKKTASADEAEAEASETTISSREKWYKQYQSDQNKQKQLHRAKKVELKKAALSPTQKGLERQKALKAKERMQKKLEAKKRGKEAARSRPRGMDWTTFKATVVAKMKVQDVKTLEEAAKKPQVNEA